MSNNTFQQTENHVINKCNDKLYYFEYSGVATRTVAT